MMDKEDKAQPPEQPESRAAAADRVQDETGRSTPAKLISRRNLLASAAVAGAALAAEGLFGRSTIGTAYAAPDPHVVVVSVAELRLITAPDVADIYYIRDAGREGEFYHAATDTTSPDDGALVIVSTNGKRYKRILGEYLSPKWFGAAGNGTNDDTTAFADAATAAGTLGRALYVPATSARYRLTNEITIPAGVKVYGDGYQSAIRQETRDKNVFILSDYSQVTNLRLEGDDVSANTPADKNCGIFADGKKHNLIQGCHFTRFQNGGVQLRNCQDYKIIDNWCYENKYSISTGTLNADIVVYSLENPTGRRGIISRNHCLSNNDIGIYFNANFYDLDAVISDNVCVTLSSGSEAASGGNRRHGILSTYGGSSSGRIIVSGNICRNTRITGIYRTGATNPTLQVSIIGNICSENGYENSNSLSAGIYIGNAASGDIVSDNVIENFRGTVRSNNGAIVVNKATTGLLISGNSCINSQGCGVVLVNTPKNVTVRGNTFSGNFYEDIVVNHAPSDSALGGHIIEGNTSIRPNNSASFIYLNLTDGGLRTQVRRNSARGVDSTTASSGSNSGIYLTTGTSKVVIEQNDFDTFYYGVYKSDNIPSGKTTDSIRCDNNDFRNMNTGIYAPRSASSHCWPVCGNQFASVSNRVGGNGAYLALSRDNGAYITLQGTAAPTDGTWTQSDKIWFTNAAAGAAPGAVCTAGGNPGTWKNMANLAT